MVTHRIYLRARPGVAVGMRFVKLERTFGIKAMHDPDEIGTLSRLPVRGDRAMKIAFSVTVPDLARVLADIARQAQGAAAPPSGALHGVARGPPGAGRRAGGRR